MLTVSDALKRAAECGVRVSERTFWKYHQLGLLPAGEKIAGRGNVTYFPDDTPIRLLLIHFLAEELKVNPSKLSSPSWSQYRPSPEFWSLRDLPDEQIAIAKEEYEKAKEEALRLFLQRIEKLLEPANAGQGGTSHVWKTTSPDKKVDNEWKWEKETADSED